VVPLYYGRDSQGVSPGWVERMKNALYECGARFTAQRMLRQYVAECYAPAMRRDTAGDDPPTG
jgi:starch phosphorylase